jgi:para-aminobenzoate synthetase component 1
LGFFLDSGMNGHGLGRFSLVGCQPFLVLRSHGRRVWLAGEGGTEEVAGDTFTVLGELLARYRMGPGWWPGPFPGGAVGYLGYDLGRLLERLPRRAQDDLELPEAYLGFYDTVAVFDHGTGKGYLVSTGFPEDDLAPRRERARERLARLRELLSSPPPLSRPLSCPRLNGHLSANFTQHGYEQAVETAREYIAAGDIFQVNLSQRFEAPLPLPPWELYLRLRGLNPAPFAAYLNFDGATVASASPERFLRLRGDRVATRPMKGTRPRGATPQQDRALARELSTSVKDRAENVMIVDLERSDLGRVCRFGSVRVRGLYTLEKYATVFQLTSTVEGQLREGLGAVDLLRATFPGGSVTGAPKVRAMEIIDELEPARRGPYCGSIGYLGFDGDMELNIAIRTFVIKDSRAYFQVGGAVVYDSSPQAEYRETLDKAQALMQALGVAAP